MGFISKSRRRALSSSPQWPRSLHQANLGCAWHDRRIRIAEARERAREAIGRIKDGQRAIETPKPKPESVAEVADNWLRRHVEKNNIARPREREIRRS